MLILLSALLLSLILLVLAIGKLNRVTASTIWLTINQPIDQLADEFELNNSCNAVIARIWPEGSAVWRLAGLSHQPQLHRYIAENVRVEVVHSTSGFTFKSDFRLYKEAKTRTRLIAIATLYHKKAWPSFWAVLGMRRWKTKTLKRLAPLLKVGKYS